MIYQILKKSENLLNIKEAKAHCDVPCGIYDPSTAIISALTAIRMIDLISELKDKYKEGCCDKEKCCNAEYNNSLLRYIAEKENHCIKAKEEIRIIWGDYIKAPQIEKYPNIHTLTHKIMMAGSKTKQTIDRTNALEFLKLINEFAEIFWDSKGIKTKKVKAPYLPGEEVVYPVL